MAKGTDLINEGPECHRTSCLASTAPSSTLICTGEKLVQGMQSRRWLFAGWAQPRTRQD